MRELSECEIERVSGGEAVVEDWSPHPMSEEEKALARFIASTRSGATYSGVNAAWEWGTRSSHGGYADDSIDVNVTYFRNTFGEFQSNDDMVAFLRSELDNYHMEVQATVGSIDVYPESASIEDIRDAAKAFKAMLSAHLQLHPGTEAGAYIYVLNGQVHLSNLISSFAPGNVHLNHPEFAGGSKS